MAVEKGFSIIEVVDYENNQRSGKIKRGLPIRRLGRLLKLS